MNAVAKADIPVADLNVGDEVSRPPRKMTWDRMRWYSVGLRSSARGEITKPGVNIHTDEEVAKGQGLPGAIADGMILTNWCSSMLLEHFGWHYLERGALRTKFIKPAMVNANVTAHFRIVEKEKTDGGIRYKMDVWCADENGVKLTDADASVEVR